MASWERQQSVETKFYLVLSTIFPSTPSSTPFLRPLSLIIILPDHLDTFLIPLHHKASLHGNTVTYPLYIYINSYSVLSCPVIPSCTELLCCKWSKYARKKQHCIHDVFVKWDRQRKRGILMSAALHTSAVDTLYEPSENKEGALWNLSAPTTRACHPGGSYISVDCSYLHAPLANLVHVSSELPHMHSSLIQCGNPAYAPPELSARVVDLPALSTTDFRCLRILYNSIGRTVSNGLLT